MPGNAEDKRSWAVCEFSQTALTLEELKRLWGFCYLVPTTRTLKGSMPKGPFVALSG
jgi:hypothetical protein